MSVNLYSASEFDHKNAPFRRRSRALFSVPIILRHLSPRGIRTTRGISLDLGEGGLGAIVQGELRVGDTVGIDLGLSEQVLPTVAIVRHTSSVRSGFEFVNLTQAGRLQITNALGST